MRRYADGWLGRVRIGTSITVRMYLLPPILRELKRAYPRLEISLKGRTDVDDPAIAENALARHLAAIALFAEEHGSHPVWRSHEPCRRVVITGWESLDEVKKWQAGEYSKLIALRDQVAKVRQFAIATCQNPQGAKPGQTKCPL